MESVKCYAAMKSKEPLKPHTISRRNPAPHDVVIDITHCGVCHSDIHQVRDEWGVGAFPMVPGHEIVGTVSAIGNQVTRYQVGNRVGVGCMVDSCRHCRPCERSLEQFCEKGANFTYNSLEKDGKTPTYGGYSKCIVVDENYVLKIPDNIPFDKAAPLLCAGITTYSPLIHWKVKKGDKVAVMGLGGLGHMGVKLAVAMGAEVTVISSSDKKKQDALSFGAAHFINTSQENALANYAGYFDLILNTISVEIDMNAFLGLLKIDGSMVLLGVPEKQIVFHPQGLIHARRRLAGSLIGGLKETQEMLDFCGKNNIVPDIEVIEISKINEAYERMIRGDVRYRFVIDISSL
ncbi:MAG TPA: NAD(P)-dependent alcohol dehydrogenase [Gammaproteobacteria bacterium]|jgi:uncharacterized zinc-type alcohol dehydrogenase-like protein|nr:NAD(P)-dependent alcohol dehydrogenase [Gammaproteobacteria bacterium]